MANRVALLNLDNSWSVWLTNNQMPFTIGRHHDNDLVINSTSVSKQHCRLNYKGKNLILEDTNSYNGTVIQDKLINNNVYRVKHSSCILLGDTMLWVTPCNEWGQVLPNKKVTEKDSGGVNGVCIVDICDSTELDTSVIGYTTKLIKKLILNCIAEDLLLLKNLGDGYLAITSSAESTLILANQLLTFQSGQNNKFKVDIRVTLDAGPTFEAVGNDRLGMAINRAARIEKTQKQDLISPGKKVDKLKVRNRCIMSEFYRRVLNKAEQNNCLFIGKRNLKGFGDFLYKLYQYDGN